MASFRKTKSKKGVRWQAVVRMKGHALVRTFDRSDDARAWATAVESAISNHSVLRPFAPEDWMHVAKAEPGGIFTEILAAARQEDVTVPSASWTLHTALDHYDRTVTDTRKGCRQERARIAMWQQQPLAKRRLSDITADDIAAFVTARQAGVGFRKPAAASTIRNDVSRISALYRRASLSRRRGGWGLQGLVNPCDDILLPALPPPRDMRFDIGEEDDPDRQADEVRLFKALADGLDPDEMTAIVSIALDTGMRRSEILSLTADEYRRTRSGPELRKGTTKNGKPRRIVIDERCSSAIRALIKLRPHGPLFTLDADAVASRWRRARKGAAMAKFNFHDLRHESCSNMIDKGLSLTDVMQRSGHSSIASLGRYVHSRTSNVRSMLYGERQTTEQSEDADKE